MDITLDATKAKKVQDIISRIFTACHRLFAQMSNAVVGTIADMYNQDQNQAKDDPDYSIRVLLKENRHMYIALTLVLVLTLYTLFFRQ